MNKRVTIEMPDEMHRLIERHAAETGRDPDAYVLELIEQHLEDQYFLTRAEEATRRIESGESQVVGAEEFWRDLDD